MKKTRDYHAKLVIHDMDNISEAHKQQMAVWLKRLARYVEKARKGKYYKLYTAKFMK